MNSQTLNCAYVTVEVVIPSHKKTIQLPELWGYTLCSNDVIGTKSEQHFNTFNDFYEWIKCTLYSPQLKIIPDGRYYSFKKQKAIRVGFNDLSILTPKNFIGATVSREYHSTNNDSIDDLKKGLSANDFIMLCKTKGWLNTL